ncbi:MAG: Nascent polypeptide-associated complex protein [Thermoplasmata archaeon]|nr:Nascent polypeptide-associated complex protein [Thermoplasmata archaeon]
MIPGMGRGMNPRQLKVLMKRLGIQIEELEGVRAVIIVKDDKEIHVNNPTVTVMKTPEGDTVQVAGEMKEMPPGSYCGGGETEVAEGSERGIPEEDIELVMEQTGVSRERAVEALEATGGSPAEAILKIMEGGG